MSDDKREARRKAIRAVLEQPKNLKQHDRVGMHGRWCLIDEGSYETCLKLGYTPVMEKDADGKEHNVVATTSKSGRLKNGQKAVLMEIPKEEYELIQQIKSEEIDEIEKALGQEELAAFKKNRLFNIPKKLLGNTDK